MRDTYQIIADRACGARRRRVPKRGEDRSAPAALQNIVSSINDDLDGSRQSELAAESWGLRAQPSRSAYPTHRPRSVNSLLIRFKAISLYVSFARLDIDLTACHEMELTSRCKSR